MYVRDCSNHRIQVLDSNGNYIQSVGSQGSVDDGVQVFDANTNFLFQFGSEGTENGQFSYPIGLAATACVKHLLVCDLP
jgi:DNA-binding beta-propeller fold protein YncE